VDATVINHSREALTISRILRVNHAGELGAINIYAAQIALARRDDDLRAFLSETLSHEREHARQFLALMPDRQTRPCGAMPLWGLGGAFLGVITGLLNRNAVLICTEAVERTVHRHLDDQLAWLADRDPVLSATIRQIQTQELGHLQFALEGQSAKSLLGRALDSLIVAATETLIWLSTYGASAKMARDLQR
jgi:ubiquinone biosynthesis monooxygenase Coq7